MAFRLVVVVDVADIDVLYEMTESVVTAVVQQASQILSLKVESGKEDSDV